MPPESLCGANSNVAVRCPAANAHSPMGSSSVSQCYQPGYYERSSASCSEAVTNTGECETAAKVLQWSSTTLTLTSDSPASSGTCALYTLADGSTQLSVKPLGQSFTVMACICTALAGSFCDQTNTGAVTECPAGKYSDAKGRTQCPTCPDDTYSKEGATACEPCPILHYSDKGSKSRDSCALSAFWSVVFFFVGGAVTCSAAGTGLFACSTRVQAYIRERQGQPVANNQSYAQIAESSSNPPCTELEELDVDMDVDDADD